MGGFGCDGLTDDHWINIVLDPVLDVTLQDVGSHDLAIIGNSGYCCNQLNWCNCHTLPKGIGCQVYVCPVLIAWNTQREEGFPCQVNVGSVTNPKPVHVVVEYIRTRFRGNPGETDVQGMLHASRHGLPPPGSTIPVVNIITANFNIAVVEKLGFRFHRVGVQCGCHGENFKRGTRLECLADYAVKRRCTGIYIQDFPVIV